MTREQRDKLFTLLDNKATAQDQLVQAEIDLAQEVNRLRPDLAFDAADWANGGDLDDLIEYLEVD